MKNDQLIIIAAAAAALWIISSSRKVTIGGGAMRPGGTASSLNNGGSLPVTEITNSAFPGDIGWGWRYYSDGTAISPAGDYYLNGNRVWSPSGGNMSIGF